MFQVETIHTTRYRWWRVDGKDITDGDHLRKLLKVAAETKIAQELGKGMCCGELLTELGVADKVQYRGWWEYVEELKDNDETVEDGDSYTEGLRDKHRKIAGPDSPCGKKV